MTEQLILIRHTRIEVDEGICYGQSDLPSTSTFSSEAEQVKKSLSRLCPTKLYVSPLQRCRRLAETLGGDLHPDERLMELNFGLFEGKRWSELFESAEGKEWFANWQTATCPDGESHLQLRRRVEQFLHEKEDEKSIVMVTHAGVIRVVLSLLGILSTEESFRLPIDYGAVLELLRDPNEPTGFIVRQHHPDGTKLINTNFSTLPL